MIEVALNPRHQLVITARLAEFCRFKQYPLKNEHDPWVFMRNKLSQIEEPLANLKSELLESSRKSLIDELRKGPISNDRSADYKTLFERLLSRGDFVDFAFALMGPAGPSAPGRLEEALKHKKPVHLFTEERLPAAQRSPSWEALVKELTSRLDIERLDKVLGKKTPDERRKRIVLRRLRMNTAEYCTVVRVPLTPDDAFSPFMLSRVEAVVAANLRFLSKYR